MSNINDCSSCKHFVFNRLGMDAGELIDKMLEDHSFAPKTCEAGYVPDFHMPTYRDPECRWTCKCKDYAVQEVVQCDHA